MPSFKSLHIALGPNVTKPPQLAAKLPNPASAILGQKFRQRLNEFPLHFLALAPFEGFATIAVQWVALTKTTGLVLLRSGNADPDVIGLLLNGVESQEEMQLVRQNTPMFWHRWEQITELSKPLAVFGYGRPERAEDAAVTTVLGAFANAYFAQFGTSGE